MTADAAPASPLTALPELKSCPFCGGEAGLLTSVDYGAECGEGIVSAIHCIACHSRSPSHPGRTGRFPAANAWNALPRLADGLRPEAPASVDTAASVAWIVRALPILAERLGVRLPPFPRRPT